MEAGTSAFSSPEMLQKMWCLAHLSFALFHSVSLNCLSRAVTAASTKHYQRKLRSTVTSAFYNHDVF